MAEHVIGANPTKPVTIDGTTYRMEVGNVTTVLDIARWQEALTAASDDPATGVFQELADSGVAIVRSALGAQAAEDLMGGDNRLNLWRLVKLLGVIAEEMAGAEAMAEFAEAAAGFADTADYD